MNYSVIKYFCTSNGPGVRTAVFVSGCRLHCKGCFNKIAWDFNSGKELTDEKISEMLDSIEKPFCEGLSILGGEPLDEKNLDGVSHIVDMFRERFGYTKDIWIWSGYYVSDMTENQKKVANMCDFIVDGPFIDSEHDNDLVFKGSKNQHILKSLHNGEFEDANSLYNKE